MEVRLATFLLTAAFGGFAGLLPELRSVTEEMMLADSVTLDGKHPSTAYTDARAQVAQCES